MLEAMGPDTPAWFSSERVRTMGCVTKVGHNMVARWGS